MQSTSKMLPIAVIIANYNNARFLPQCLQSVFIQDHPLTEIVVVDDASTDGSQEILRPLANAGRIRLLENDMRRGVSACRIQAIEASSSPFITTLDADDYFYRSDKLSAEAKVILNDTGGKIIAFSDVLRVNEKGRPIYLVSSKRKLREGDLSSRIIYQDGFVPRDYLISKSLYTEAGGFNPALTLYEDWDLKIRLSMFCSWRYSGVIGTAYRDNPRGLSKSPFQHHVLAMRKIFNSNRKYTPWPLPYIQSVKFFVYQSLFFRRFAIASD